MKTSLLNFLYAYWPILTLALGFYGNYLRMNYGVLRQRFVRWVSVLMFWISIGVLIPNSLHSSVWWIGPLAGAIIAIVVLSVQDFTGWLERNERNMMRRMARRRRG